ncbi:MAG: hypothetical protein Q8M15_12340 [Bacteroidota bacterium]|nr:hypothetical protein [Bacteroidota bacterium]
MNKYLKYMIPEILLSSALLLPLFTCAQYPSIKLSFIIQDTVKVCKAVVMNSETEPAKDVSVAFFVKRFFGMLPIGTSVSTDEKGVATVNYPLSVPADDKGNVVVVVRLEDDESIAAEANSPWGIKISPEDVAKKNALWAPRSNVALTLMLISNLIIIAIWGVMAYIVYQVFYKIRKIGMQDQSYKKIDLQSNK